MAATHQCLRRRGFLAGVLATVGASIRPAEAHSGELRVLSRMSSRRSDWTSIALYPGDSHSSWGFPDVSRVAQWCDANVIQYRLDRRWVRYRDRLAGELREDLERGSHVVLVAYSMGACAAVDVLAGAALDEGLAAKLSLVLVAPAARVRDIWARLVPADLWQERWRMGSDYLCERRKNGGSVWRDFFDQRIRLLYNDRDLFVMADGFSKLASVLPASSKRACSDIRHLGWRSANRLTEAIQDVIRSAGVGGD